MDDDAVDDDAGAEEVDAPQPQPQPRSRARRSIRRWPRALVAMVAIVATALSVNAWVSARESRAAQADVGRIVEVPEPDLQISDSGATPSGRTIVLLHGWTESLRMWDQVLPDLEATTTWVAQRSIPDRLRDLPLPLLVVTGGEDQLVAPDATVGYDGRPDTRVVVLDGVGHTPPVEAPSRTAALLREASASS